MGSIQGLQFSNASLANQATCSLRQIRGIDVRKDLEVLFQTRLNIFDALHEVIVHLRSMGHVREADVFDHVVSICKTPTNYGGLGLEERRVKESDIAEVGFLISAWLESLNSADRSRQSHRPAEIKPAGRRPMTLTEKIFAMKNIEPTGAVHSGDTIRVFVDWIMASEASWSSMERTYNELGEPGIFRNDRFWLAGDHVVDPRVSTHPAVQRLVESSERAKKIFKMTEYQGMNYTIMHTEFYRERAQPGMIVIGSDSHTCSSGAVGCLAIGLGAADVTMAMVTGEIWFKVPECVNIRLVGQPGKGIGGKDVILYILQQLKRNTVAADRVVEYTGPGLKYLSSDARFAICNMTTEFGGITGIFVPDDVTNTFISTRKVSRHKSSANYFRPDDDAVYTETHVIDLSETEPFIAKYPNPDDVVSVTEMTGAHLDGCFIGACTTAEEDIILGALVLEQGLKHGLTPVARGSRKVVPGSLPILDKLRKSGLAEIYEQAGFEIGLPGCSYCVGMSADKAGEGEVWLSSQNRNFENRMGKGKASKQAHFLFQRRFDLPDIDHDVGSIGNLASAATVAASSFGMEIRDPRHLIESIDTIRWDKLRGRGSLQPINGDVPHYVEPFSPEIEKVTMPTSIDSLATSGARDTGDTTAIISQHNAQNNDTAKLISGKVQRLGDFIDTDALAPAQYLIECRTNEAIGSHCLEFTDPGFRDRVKSGFDIVVAGRAFGCGSSREQAVSALLGCGVKCVIARSFAFIYSRNQPSLGLLGIAMEEDEFFEAAKDGISIDINLAKNFIVVDGREFPFQLSKMERELIDLGGITPAFMKFGKQVFDALCSSGNGVKQQKVDDLADSSCGSSLDLLKW
ncbi:Fc.00g072570.m01.CDS01 [Cosmosporella sp. VM-42]